MRLSSCLKRLAAAVGGQDDLVGRCGRRRVCDGVLGGILGGGGVLSPSSSSARSASTSGSRAVSSSRRRCSFCPAAWGWPSDEDGDEDEDEDVDEISSAASDPEMPEAATRRSRDALGARRPVKPGAKRAGRGGRRFVVARWRPETRSSGPHARGWVRSRRARGTTGATQGAATPRPSPRRPA